MADKGKSIFAIKPKETKISHENAVASVVELLQYYDFDVEAITEDFNIMDAASADYARREMDKADAEFERAVMGDCPECGSTMIDARCTNKERHNG